MSRPVGGPNYDRRDPAEGGLVGVDNVEADSGGNAAVNGVAASSEYAECSLSGKRIATRCCTPEAARQRARKVVIGILFAVGTHPLTPFAFVRLSSVFMTAVPAPRTPARPPGRLAAAVVTLQKASVGEGPGTRASRPGGLSIPQHPRDARQLHPCSTRMQTVPLRRSGLEPRRKCHKRPGCRVEGSGRVPRAHRRAHLRNSCY